MLALRAPADGAFCAVRAPASRRSRARSVTVRAAAEAEETPDSSSFDARAFRRALGQSENYSRKHMRDEEAAAAMEAEGVGAISAGELQHRTRSECCPALTALAPSQAVSLRR